MIIMIWVDDLLLFADSLETMKRMKKDIQDEWEMTDMGDPSKIMLRPWAYLIGTCL